MLVKLSLTMSSLPKRDAILKSKNNKRKLASVLSTFSVTENVTMETIDNGASDHDEADITIISYVLAAANYGKNVISVFILLVYRVYRAKLEYGALGWGTVLDTCSELGPQCLQLLGMHALSGCDTTSYPYSNGRAIPCSLETFLV